MDEAFGVNNFVADITYERSGSAGLGQGGLFVNNSEHIIIYSKGTFAYNDVLGFSPLELKTMKRYNKVLVDEGTRELISTDVSKSNGKPIYIYKHSHFEIRTISLRDYNNREQEIRNEFVKNFKSLFRTNNVQAGNIIKVEEIEENISSSQISWDFEPHEIRKEAYSTYGISKNEKSDELIDKAVSLVKEEVAKEITASKKVEISKEQKKKITDKVAYKIKEDKDLSEVFKENENPFYHWLDNTVEETHQTAKEKFIPIPRLKVTDEGVVEYGFVDFDLDLSEFKHAPIRNDLLIQNLEDLSDLQRIDGDAIDFDGYNPKKVILELLRTKPEIDYEKCSTLLFKLISQVVNHYKNKYDTNLMQNIVMMNKKDIANKIYHQMMQDNHFYCENGFIKYSVMDTREYNLTQTYTWDKKLNLYESYDGNIKSILFDGIKKGVFDTAKFDSFPELLLARVLENDKDVINWLRPAQTEFNITYNRGRHYIPDFVVETSDSFFVVEVKGEDKINDADVIAKGRKAVMFCEVVSSWSKANNKKEWKYVFIPSKQILPTSSFDNLINRFTEV